jgi:hypothetical protein
MDERPSTAPLLVDLLTRASEVVCLCMEMVHSETRSESGAAHESDAFRSSNLGAYSPETDAYLGQIPISLVSDQPC